MAMVGKLNPEMENDSTPHKEAALMAILIQGNRQKRNTPKACVADTARMEADIMGSSPPFNGKWRYP